MQQVESLKKKYDSLRKGKYFNCDYCGNIKYLSASEIGRRNKKHVFCTRECYYKFQKEHFKNDKFIKSPNNKGENNGRYKHGGRVGFHDRHRQLKEQLKARDGEGCILCRCNEKIHIHRILPGGLGGKYELNNTIMLCNVHHAAVHKDYDTWKNKLEELVFINLNKKSV